MPIATDDISRRDQAYLWIRRNRGVCKQIAIDLEVSSELVRKILYGEYLPKNGSIGYEVSKRLRLAGAPRITPVEG